MTSGCFPRLFFLVFCLILLPVALAAPVTRRRPPVLIGLASGPNEDAQIWGVGTWDGRRGWREFEASKKEFRPGSTFGVYGLTGKTGSATGKKMTESPEVHGWAAGASNARGFPGDGKNALAISGTRNAALRRVRVQSNDGQIYVKLVKDWLMKNGLPDAKPRLTQNLRVDLDGDGTDEVLICASSRPDFGHTPEIKIGDYTLVLLRAVSKNGKTQTVALASEINKKAVQFSAPGYAQVLACADVNGDGKMEIALSTGYYEGFGMELWTWNGANARSVLGFGVGV